VQSTFVITSFHLLFSDNVIFMSTGVDNVMINLCVVTESSTVVYYKSRTGVDNVMITSVDKHPSVAISGVVDKSISLSTSIPNLSPPTGSVQSVSIR
jgi:hypothetical protein